MPWIYTDRGSFSTSLREREFKPQTSDQQPSWNISPILSRDFFANFHKEHNAFSYGFELFFIFKNAVF